MDITFFGAAGMVTGSCYLINFKNKKILLECGLFQGSKDIQERNYAKFPFDPKEIDVVLLSHAHIDHSGLIPKLCNEGFQGKIYTTNATKELCTIMLRDSGYIQEMEVERKNRKLKRANKPLLNPIYTESDGENCIKQFVGVDYNTEIELLSEVKVLFKDAGHIIGSAIVELYLGEKKLVFSGDLGNINQAIINDPTKIKSADYLMIESTYGNRFHIETEDKLVQLTRIIKKTLKKGGNLIIPAFAIERTQEIIYHLRQLITSGEIPLIDVYLDSPLAIKATEIFSKYPDLYDVEAQEIAKSGNLFKFPGLKFTPSAEESRSINGIKKNAIIISASGMCEAGRIKHHLKHNLWRPESTILFIGFQAKGTLGRRILDGEKIVRIHGDDVAIRADIERIEGFSAHADQKALIDWVKNFNNTPEKIILVHGEEEARSTLARILQDETESQIIEPFISDIIKLNNIQEVQGIENKITYNEEDIRSVLNKFETDLSTILDRKGKSLIQDELDKIKEKLRTS